MSSAKFSGITATLERRIRQGKYIGKLPTTRALASEFGVARQTVTNALRPLVEEGILQPAGKRGMLIAADTPEAPRIIAIVSGASQHETMQRPCYQLLLQSLVRDGFSPLFLSMPPHYKLLNPARIFKDDYAGVLFIGSSLTLETALYLEEKCIPFLSCNRLPPYPKLNYVETDNRSALVSVMRHLSALGYRRVAFFWVSALEGYQRLIQEEWSSVAEECGLEDLPCNHLNYEGVTSRADAMRRFAESVESGEKPDLLLVWGSYLGNAPQDYDALVRLSQQDFPVLTDDLWRCACDAPLTDRNYFYSMNNYEALYPAAVAGLLEMVLAKPTKPIHRKVLFDVALSRELPRCHQTANKTNSTIKNKTNKLQKKEKKDA